MNLNRVILVGRIASDVEMLTTQTGKKVCKIALATNRVFKGQDGSKREEATFHNIVLWERLAEIVHTYSKKGNVLLVEGRIQNRSYEDKEGRKRYISEVIA
ncbi:MAG: single-stranded DNA-binding protein, partial [Candidatus Paceibacterota bacterium]